jgi:proliferating cell nuclear antigen PCNA
MSQLFTVKTKEGYTIKVLAEALNNTLKEACFVCKPTGIYLTGMDSKEISNGNVGTKLVQIVLPKEKFNIYKTPPQDFNIGLNMLHFYKMLKSIKKKDSLTLCVSADDPTKLQLIIEQPGENPVVKYINIINIQAMNIKMPGDSSGVNVYQDAIIATTKEFQKLKTLSKVSKYINVTTQNKMIDFFCDKDNIYSCQVSFGESDSDNVNEEEAEMYSQKFETEQIIQLIKIGGLSNTVQIFSHPSLPLKFKLNVGSLGEICIFIKSQEQLFSVDDEEEECDDEVEEEESEE